MVSLRAFYSSKRVGSHMLAAALATTVLAAAVPQARADDTAPAPAPAAAPAAAPAHWYDSISLSGSVDLYYDYNTNSPADRTNQLQNWTTRNNQFAIPLAELSLTQASTAASPVGFKFTLGYGDAMDLIDYQPDNAAYKNIKEAYVTYLVGGKSATPTTLTLGKFVTPNGAEVIESQNNWNYTHSLLFVNAIPYYHTGLSISRPLTSTVTLTGYLVNGWDTVVDNNNAKTLGYSAAWAATPKLSIIQNGMFGPETAGDEHHWRSLLDTVVTYTATPKLSLMLNHDYGHDDGMGVNSTWQGIAGYARYALDGKSAVAARAEVFNDKDGFRTGTPGEYKEVTLTYEHHYQPSLLTRFEVRYDLATNPYFEQGSGHSKHQMQFVIGTVFTFGG